MKEFLNTNIEKIKDFFDILYIKTIEIYKDVYHWYKTCGKYIQHWKFVMYCMFHCYPWDFTFFYRLQYEWLKKSQIYFNDKCYCSEEKINRINKYQRKCISLLEIILNIKDYWDYDHKKKGVIMKIPYNLKNKERFPYIGIDSDGNEILKTDIYEKNPDEYYKYKAIYLYHKILKERAGEWWD